jgi:hypothetical protein
MSDYNSLLTDIPAWMENNSAELAAVVPQIIVSAQNRMFRDLDVQQLETFVNGTLTAGVQTFSRPSDLIQPRYARITTASGQLALQFKQLEYLFELWPTGALTTSQPIYYGVYDSTEYLVAPTPDLNYPYQFGYKQRLPYLSVANPSNVLTDLWYDALLAACLAEAARFVLDDRQATLISIWENKYGFLVKGINDVDRRAERDDFRIMGFDAANK